MNVSPGTWPSAGARLIRASCVLIAVCAAILFFWRGFFDPDEGRYSEIPREMVESGNWLEMRMLGYRYYEKPPFAYWAVAAAIKIFGAYEWAVRVPLLLAAAVLALAFFVAMRREWGKAEAAVGLLVALTCAGVAMGSCLLLTDAFLTMWFALTCLAIYRAFQPNTSRKRKNMLLLCAGAAAAMGFLSKGAVALVLPSGIAFLWLLWEKRLKELFCPAVFGAAALAVLILAPALYVLEKHNPGFFRHFVVEEHIGRFTGSREMQVHPEPFWFFAYVLPLLLLPWTFFAPAAVANARRCAAPADGFTRYLLVWAGAVFVFFSAGTGKLMSYILPGFFPIVALVARWGVLPVPQQGGAGRRLWLLGAAGSVLTALLAAAAWCCARAEVGPFRGYRISAESAAALLPLAAGLAAMVGAKKIGLFPRVLFLNSCLMLAAALLLSPLAGKDFNVLAHINSSHVYKALARGLQPDDALVVFWSYRPALPFYTRRMYLPFQEKNELVYGMRLEPERPADVKDVPELARRLAGRQGRVFALVEPRDYEHKFLPLRLRHSPSEFPSDPDTVVWEIFP